MDLLKRIPLHYKGELHDVRLINFSVTMEEVRNKVPAGITPRNFNGRAMISMVDVNLKNMRPVLFPLIRFNYRHIAFRLLVDDSKCNHDENKGIFFLRSFTNKRWIAAAGKLLTDYNLEFAAIHERENVIEVAQGDKHVRYCLDGLAAAQNAELQHSIGAIDRAYSILGNTVRVTMIQREKWPIQLVDCTGFENTFFQTAKYEGAFRVFETIHYDWVPP